MIEVKNITIQYPTETPIQDMSFLIRKGEKVCLVGESGSGKSSLLNAIAGFVSLTTGTILVDHISLHPKSLPEIRKKLAWLPQELNLELDTVLNLVYYPFSFKENKKIRPSKQQVQNVFATLLLEAPLLEKQLSEISGGQKQRVALASVLLLNKAILLLDEPSAALDDRATKALSLLLNSLTNTTILISSHDKRLIDNMERIIEIKNKY
ncbi:MAG: ATP-binding cassette domain-containing protein [Bacteroidales bacterium]